MYVSQTAIEIINRDVVNIPTCALSCVKNDYGKLWIILIYTCRCRDILKLLYRQL